MKPLLKPFKRLLKFGLKKIRSIKPLDNLPRNENKTLKKFHTVFRQNNKTLPSAQCEPKKNVQTNKNFIVIKKNKRPSPNDKSVGK